MDDKKITENIPTLNASVDDSEHTKQDEYVDEEQELKRKLEELRKRDPFIYR